MIIDFYGPVAGRRHDSHVLNASLFNERLRQVHVGEPVQDKYYADKEYYSKVMGIVLLEEASTGESASRKRAYVSSASGY